MMNPAAVLVVEDEAIVSMEISERLIAMGYAVAGIASSGRQALELAQSARPNLVLMDIRLEGEMDGIEAAEEIHKLHSIPVIFLTAYSEEAALARAGKAEPHGYILKPFNDIELKAAIEIALYKHQAEEEMRRLNRLYDVLEPGKPGRCARAGPGRTLRARLPARGGARENRFDLDRVPE